MSGVTYLTNLRLVRYKDQRGGADFVLTHEFVVIVRVAGSLNGVRICVPAGFETDLNSVPRGFRWLVSVVDGIEGAIVHDFLYRVPGKHGRAWADEGLATMDKDQIGWLTRNVKWLGVRAGGWFTWRKMRRSDTTLGP